MLMVLYDIYKPKKLPWKTIYCELGLSRGGGLYTAGIVYGGRGIYTG